MYSSSGIYSPSLCFFHCISQDSFVKVAYSFREVQNNQMN